MNTGADERGQSSGPATDPSEPGNSQDELPPSTRSGDNRSPDEGQPPPDHQDEAPGREVDPDKQDSSSEEGDYGGPADLGGVDESEVEAPITPDDPGDLEEPLDAVDEGSLEGLEAGPTWRPQPPIDGAWHCGQTDDVLSIWSAQNCVIVKNGGFQTAIVVRNRSSKLVPMSALTRHVEDDETYECTRSGVAAGTYSVCFGAARAIRPGTTRITAEGELIDNGNHASIPRASVDFK